MMVSELAEELGMPTSAVLAQCRRFGFEASWAGSELGGSEVVVIRAELAVSTDLLDLRTTSSDPAPAPSSPPPMVMPPTAVGSIPELYEALDPAPGERQGVPGPAVGGFRMAGADDHTAGSTQARSAPTRVTKKRFARQVRVAVVALALAMFAFAASNVVSNPWAVAALWVLTGVLLGIAMLDGARGSRHVSVHPDKLKGRWVARATLAIATVGLAGLGLSVFASVAEQPASEAPLGVGDLSSVQQARWGHQRINRIYDEGWKRPAKDEGTCWALDDEIVRDVERVEIGTERVDCSTEHTLEVIQVFAMNRDADAPFPGADAIAAAAAERCGPTIDAIAESEAGQRLGVALVVEHPTSSGWEDGDHDVACVAVSGVTSGSFTD